MNSFFSLIIVAVNIFFFFHGGEKEEEEEKKRKGIVLSFFAIKHLNIKFKEVIIFVHSMSIKRKLIFNTKSFQTIFN